MPDKQDEPHVLYTPDTPDDPIDGDDRHAAKERARRDELAAEAGIGDELSGYEKVAGKGAADG